MALFERLFPVFVLLVTVDIPLLWLSWWFKKNPPEAINSFYGYRTARSKKNKETWLEGNRHSGAIFFRFCFWLLPVQLISAVVWNGMAAGQVTAAFIVILAIITIASTEAHLHKTFNV